MMAKKKANPRGSSDRASIYGKQGLSKPKSAKKRIPTPKSPSVPGRAKKAKKTSLKTALGKTLRAREYTYASKTEKPRKVRGVSGMILAQQAAKKNKPQSAKAVSTKAKKRKSPKWTYDERKK